MNWMSSEPRGIDSAMDRCPSHAELLQFLQDDSENSEKAWIAGHLDRCTSCSSAAERITSREHWDIELRAFQEPTRQLSADDFGTDHIRSSSSAVSRATISNLSIPAFVSDRFRNLELIGRGGCAKVFRAEDTALGRTVALKFPHPTLLADPSAKKRFLTELRATAALQHPHIVALYDAGFDEYQGHIVFEYVQGPTLAEWLSSQRHPVDNRIAAVIVKRLANGVQHAHEAGILHRDLKPSNVLLDESRPSGTLPFVPRIADFGIARFFNSDVTQTIDDTVLGSPPFMSPEQAMGDRNRIGPASDVYALGGILYQLLTQQLPIQGASTADTLRRVLTDEPILPRRYRSEIPRDLEAICMKSLAKDPRKRYSSASALERDLEHFLADEPVSVRPPGLWENIVRTTRKHPVWTALAGTMVATAALVMVLLARHNAAVEELANELSTRNTELVTANSDLGQSLKEVKTARDEAQELVYAYDMRRAFEAAKTGDSRMVRSVLDRYADGSDLSALRSIGWQYLWLRSNRPHRTIFCANSPVYMSTLSPDGKTLAVVGQDAHIRLFDFETGGRISEWPSGQGEVNGVCFSPDGENVWTAGDDGTIVFWNCITHERRYSINAHGTNMAFEVVYDVPRRQIISCGSEGTIRIWDADTGQSKGELTGHQQTVDSIQLHPDGESLYSQAADVTVRNWDLASLYCKDVIEVPGPKGIRFLRISPDGRWLAGCNSQYGLVLCDFQRGNEVSVQSTINSPTRVCFDPTSRRLFVGDSLGAIEVWMLESGDAGESKWSRTDCVWQAHQDQISHLEWSSHTRELISASRDGDVLAWKGLNEDDLHQRDIHHRGIHDFVEIPGENLLLIAGDEGVFLEPLVPGTASSVEGATPSLLDSTPRRRIAVSRDGTLWAAGSVDGRVALWHRGEDHPYADVSVFETLTAGLLTFTPDGKYLCAAARGAIDAMWVDTTTGQVEPISLPHPCQQIQFSRDGTLFAAAFDKTLQVVDWNTQQLRCELPTPPLFKWTVRFFPDNLALAVAHERKVRICDAANGRLVRELLGHEGNIRSLAISSDGRTLVSGSGDDGTVQLWHVPTGQNLTSIQINWAKWCRCILLKDDRWLAYTLDDNSIRIERIR